MLRTSVVVLAVIGLSSCNCGSGGGSDGGADAGHDGGVDAGTDAGTDGGLSALCVASGGTVSTSSCCLAAGDFPNQCAIGACSCAPANSHDVQVCDCGTGCFDPSAGCVSPDAGMDAGLAALCEATGGSVSTGSCCLGTGDFPNLCATGACGCAPANSHDVQVCTCGAGCFDPAVGCVRPDAGVDDGGADGGDEARCTATNGSVVETLCCAATGDFPNLCAVGACGCAPSSSHLVRTCACTSGQCYEPGLGCH